MAERSLRVLFQCTGVGILNRGIESFFREAFDGLKNTPGLEATLIKGAGKPGSNELVAWCLPRTGGLASFFGKLAKRNSYVIEQWSSLFHVAILIRKLRPQVIFYSDSNLGFLLYRFRKEIGIPYSLLYSNGGPCRPPFTRRDFVQQVAPLYLEEALQFGEDPKRHFLVPYGIGIPDSSILRSDKEALLRQLGLPVDRPIVLSVGWIAREHKRMHYVIEEVAKMQGPRPFLQLLGAIDEKSPEIIELAQRLLGEGNFSIKSEPYEKVSHYYRAADCFVLASLKEGFGRVYLESLLHGLPTIGHCHPVIEYVLGDVGIIADLSQPGVLSDLLFRTLQRTNSEEQKLRRWQSVRDRFGWENLAEKYLEMFQAASHAAS